MKRFQDAVLALAIGLTLGFGAAVRAEPTPGGNPGPCQQGRPCTVTKLKVGTAGVTFGDGTRQTTAASGSSVLPSQGGNSGKFLTTNGNAASWGAVSSGIGANGSPKQAAYFADGGWLVGDVNDTFDPATGFVTVGGGKKDNVRLYGGDAGTVTIDATGGDTNIDINVTPKGSGSLSTTSITVTGAITSTGAAILASSGGNNLQLRTNGGQTQAYYALQAGQQRTNQITVDGSSTGNPTTITATGSDSVIDVDVEPKSITGRFTVAGSPLAGFGTFANRPSSGYNGRLYTATDARGTFIDNGNLWQPLIGGIAGYSPASAATYTDFERSTGTVPTLTDGNGVLHFSSAADVNGSAPKINGFVRSLSGATLYVEGAANVTSTESIAGGFYSFAVVMLESATGKIASFSLFTNASVSGTTTYFLTHEYWANAGSRSVSANYTLPFINGPVFLKLALSGANVLYQFSSDRTNWTTVASVAISTIFTTGPDRVGFGTTLNGPTDVITYDLIDFLSGT